MAYVLVPSDPPSNPENLTNYMDGAGGHEL